MLITTQPPMGLVSIIGFMDSAGDPQLRRNKQRPQCGVLHHNS